MTFARRDISSSLSSAPIPVNHGYSGDGKPDERQPVAEQHAEMRRPQVVSAEGDAGKALEGARRDLVHVWAAETAGKIGLLDPGDVAGIAVIEHERLAAVARDADQAVADDAGHPERTLDIEGEPVRVGAVAELRENLAAAEPAVRADAEPGEAPPVCRRGAAPDIRLL